MRHKLNDAIHDHIAEVNACADQLHMLAWALDMVGMTKPADDLMAIAAHLPASAKAISAAYSEDLNARVREGEQSVGTMLSAIVAGVIREPAKRTA